MKRTIFTLLLALLTVTVGFTDQPSKKAKSSSTSIYRDGLKCTYDLKIGPAAIQSSEVEFECKKIKKTEDGTIFETTTEYKFDNVPANQTNKHKSQVLVGNEKYYLLDDEGKKIEGSASSINLEKGTTETANVTQNGIGNKFETTRLEDEKVEFEGNTYTAKVLKFTRKTQGITSEMKTWYITLGEVEVAFKTVLLDAENKVIMETILKKYELTK